MPENVNYSADKLKLLYLYNQDRGKDSIGFYTPKNGIVKKLGKPENVLASGGFDVPEDSFIIGHVRAATIGSIVEKNAHPFEEGDVVLAMNGTLTNHNLILKQRNLDPINYDVDSQALCAIINADKSFKSLSEINGGCAIITYNKSTGVVNVFRNSQRPLYRGSLDGGIYVSSTDTPLKIIGCTNIKEFKEDYLYTIINGRILQSIKQKKFELPKKESLYDIESDTRLNYYQMKDEDLVGQYVYLDTASYYGPDKEKEKNLKLLYGYKVKSVNYNEVVIEDSKGEDVKILKYKLKASFSPYAKNEFVAAISDLNYTEKSETGLTVNFCKKDDILVINDIYYKNGKKRFDVTNIINGKEAALFCNDFRKVFDEEYSEIMDRKFPNCDISFKEEEPEKVIMNNIPEISNSKEGEEETEEIEDLDYINCSLLDFKNYFQAVNHASLDDYMIEINECEKQLLDYIEDAFFTFNQSYKLSDSIEKIKILNECMSQLLEFKES